MDEIAIGNKIYGVKVIEDFASIDESNYKHGGMSEMCPACNSYDTIYLISLGWYCRGCLLLWEWEYYGEERKSSRG